MIHDTIEHTFKITWLQSGVYARWHILPLCCVHRAKAAAANLALKNEVLGEVDVGPLFGGACLLGLP